MFACVYVCLHVCMCVCNEYLLSLLQAHKFAIVVQLLLGEIPDKATFREPTLKKPLLPYFRLTQGLANQLPFILVNILLFPPAVRSGDLVHFNEVLQQYKEKFVEEKTYTLIIR